MTEARDFSDLPTRAQLLSMSWYEFMCAMRDGALPHPPIARLLCYELTEVSQGAVTFAGARNLITPTQWAGCTADGMVRY